MGLREDCDEIIKRAIAQVQPDAAVKRALSGKQFPAGRLITIAVGKAAWQMAKAAKDILGSRMDCGVLITKYRHAFGPIEGMQIFEAGHPVSDQNSFLATEAALRLTENLSAEDTVLFLLSGGGSALFEKPLISAEELQQTTSFLLSCGANITQINTIRKRLSGVKGGKFAQHCAPAHVFSILLSDIIGDSPDMIASGPAYPDSSTCEQAEQIAQRYHLPVSSRMRELLKIETPKELNHAEAVVSGGVRELCAATASAVKALGYEPIILTDSLCCEAREAGSFLASIARYHQESACSLAYIAGGETVVHLHGDGMGGRNQEIALLAADGIRGLKDTAIFSIGSDGTDGPTDAAGGYVDGFSADWIERYGTPIADFLNRNDAYHALKLCNGLIYTGPTGTNVNDVSVILIKRTVTKGQIASSRKP